MKSQLHNAAFYDELNHVLAAQQQNHADQVESRWSSRAMRDREDGFTTYEIECRVSNPDDGYESGWYWADVFSVGPRGQVIR